MTPGAGGRQGERDGLKEALRAVRRLGQSEVPDPGPAYWEQFLPRVRERLRHRHESVPPDRARSVILSPLAAAASIMIVVGLAAALSSRSIGPPPGRQTVEEASLSLEAALTRARGPRGHSRRIVPETRVDPTASDPLPGVGLAELVELESDEPVRLEPFLEIGPVAVLEALEEIDSAAGLGAAWDDEELQLQLESLDATKAARLRREILGEPGQHPR